MTTVGIQKEQAGFHGKWAEFLEQHGAGVQWLDLLAGDPIEQARACDGIMWHWYHDPDHKQSARTILHVVETELGIPVFPDLSTAWHFDDKIAQAYILRAHDVPTPQTWVFWDRQRALAWAAETTYPLVFKLASGAGSSHVELIEDEPAARGKIQTMFSRSGFIPMVYVPPRAGTAERWLRSIRSFLLRCWCSVGYVALKRYPPLPRQDWAPQKNYALFQEFLDGNEFDHRITVIGDRAFGFRRMNRPGDFRASGSGVLDVDPNKIDMRCVELAFRVASALKSQSIACDIIYRANVPVVTEVSYGYANWAVHDCPGHWDRSLAWHDGHMWPEEAHVIDFLQRIQSAHQQGPR
jgi:glutathione synthase/RimK-type ligase-like ATP-grasp enzyme